MIRPSTISPEAKAYIQTKLNALAERENIQILFAVESGSRAWGFPSVDSDYDVRFVYARPRSDYLSVREFRDVIETPLENDEFLGVPLDLNGWDIRKGLRLGLHSNPILHEWLVSPVRYYGDDATVDPLRKFVALAADKAVLKYHYDRLARRAWEAETDQSQVKIKRYCYALRPALMLNWLSTRQDLPPMDVASLCENLSKPLISALSELFDLKHTCQEGDLINQQAVLDDFVHQALVEKAPRPPIASVDPVAIKIADDIFQRLLEFKVPE